MFGEWYKNPTSFDEYIVIPDFFDSETASTIHLPTPDEKWMHYDNPIEHKFVLNDFSNHPEIDEIFKCLQTDEFIEKIGKMAGIDNLEKDPMLHGAGVQCYPRNGKLDMHLDYSIHPVSGKQRRLNLIIYMNEGWKDEYGGHLEINGEKIDAGARFNTAIIFKTTDTSFHGVPKPIRCPDGLFRQSIAVYYVSDPMEDATPRYKAEFFPYKDQPVCTKLKKLYEIRKTRILTEDDLKDWPSWRSDGAGYF